MSPAKPTDQEEADFMNDLLSGLNDSIFNIPSSLNPSPRNAKPYKQNTPTKTPVKSRSLKSPISGKQYLISDTASNEADIIGLTDGAEHWNWDDMESDFVTPKKRKAPGKPTEGVEPTKNASRTTAYSRESCTRGIVQAVTQSQEGYSLRKDIIVRVEPDGDRRSVALLDDWAAADIRAGDVVNILGNFIPAPSNAGASKYSIEIDSKINILIHHPDNLITVTAISNALQCRRKPLLSSLVRSASDTTPSLNWGNMLHEVMQTCLVSGKWEESWIRNCIEDVIAKSLPDLVKIGVGIEEARRELDIRAKGLRMFARRYIADHPKPDAILTDTRSGNEKPSLLAITRTHDFEEDIWSPTFGIKGKLDVTVETVILDPGLPPFFLKPIISKGPKPLEIKTGRTVAGMEHRAQTMLYTLLTAERYGVEVPAGLLYYTQKEEVVRVPTSRNELRGLIIARNEMANSLVRRSEHFKRLNIVEDVEDCLPETIDDSWLCNRCYVVDVCMLYRKASKEIMNSASPIADIFNLKTAHLTGEQVSFFKKWEALLTLEEQDLIRFKKELWTMGAKERESKGRCIGSMIMDTSYIPPRAGSQSQNRNVHQHTYRFVRSSQNGGSLSSLLNGHLTCGDAVTVSVEPNLLALARGFIVQLAPREVLVGTDHALDLNNIETLLSSKNSAGPRRGSTQVIFRIDKDELFGGMGRLRDNIARLFFADGDVRRLQLVVDLKPPRFYEDKHDPQVEDPVVNLNDVQRRAVAKALNARDYALILGMPGTGKTTVTAAIIRALVNMGKTVLLTSYTHSAVDTILLKLVDADFSILRLGNLDKVHSDVHKFTLAAKHNASSIEQLEQQIMTPPVIATTCLSIDHALFSQRKFDYCIVDEASQITLPTCLSPLRFADKFVLVGDHFQLPPLVRSINARKGGLDISLFRRLSDAHPQAVIDLTDQYRMNKDIMLLSNKLIYGDRLRCGSKAVANRTLNIPNRQFLQSMHRHKKSTCDGDNCWIDQLMSESCKAIFVDTDAVPANDSRIGDLVQNEVEANLVYQFVETIVRCGVPPDQIGVISLYRQQVKLISHLLQNRMEIEILTADRSQGRDKECIVISMVRSNDEGQIGDLMKDWRRMNVAFTRARSKLVVLGSRKTLWATPLLKEFFSVMETQNWILGLPPKADAMHFIPSTSVSSQNKRPREDTREPVNAPIGKENVVVTAERLTKKAKTKVLTARDGVLGGRPILRDLMNNER